MPTHEEIVNTASIDGWTHEEWIEIARKLSRQLGPEYLSYRSSGGGKVPYLEGWRVINLANEIFGFDGWSTEVKSSNVEYCDITANGTFNVGMNTVVRVTLKSGSFHEDTGFGHIENARSKAMAYDKCRKEATTDAMKRALRLFGNALGNCLYDGSYTRQVNQMKSVPKKFMPSELLRAEDMFGSNPRLTTIATTNTAAEIKRSDENIKVDMITATLQSVKTPAPISRSELEEEKPLVPISEDNLLGSQIYSDSDIDYEEMEQLQREREREQEAREEETRKSSDNASQDDLDTDDSAILGLRGRQETPTTPMPEFVSARAAEAVQKNTPLPANAKFDVKYQSPSIRRTVDQNVSAPIAKRAPVLGAPKRGPPSLKSPSAANIPPVTVKNEFKKHKA